MINVLESIRNPLVAEKIQDVMSRANGLEKRHHDCYRQAAGSKETEFVELRTHCVSENQGGIEES